MSLIDFNRDPTPRQLRQFAVAAACIAGVLGYAASFWWIPVAAVAGALLLAGLFCPRSLRPLFLAVSIITYPVGMVVSELVLLSVFFLVIAPIGLILRLARQSPIRSGPDPTAGSYWSPRDNSDDVARYYRQS